MADRRLPFDSQVARPAVAMGLLYAGCYHLWVLTGVAAIGAVPPVALVVAYLRFGVDAESWHCRACGGVSFGRRCPWCARATPPTGRFLDRTARYAVVVPAGALVVEVVVVLLLEAAFQALGGVPAVARYHTRLDGTVGLWGPMGLFLLTLSAPVAYLCSVGLAALWAVVATVLRGRG